MSNTQPNFTPQGARKRTKPKVSKRKKIKIRVQINEIETKKTIEKTNETKNWFLKNKTDKPKKKRGLRIINQRGDITTDTTQIHRIIRDGSEQLNANRLDNLAEMGKFLETYNLPRLNHEEIENLEIPITSKETESVIRNLPTKKRSDGFTGEFY